MLSVKGILKPLHFTCNLYFVQDCSFSRSCSAAFAKSLRSGCRGITNGGCSLLALNSSVGALQTNSIHSMGLGVSSSGPEKQNNILCTILSNSDNKPMDWTIQYCRACSVFNIMFRAFYHEVFLYVPVAFAFDAYCARR